MISTLESLTGRNYLSYSSFTSWLDCGERFRLERVMQAPQRTGWWLVGGHAVHKATEDLDLGLATDPTTAFNNAWDDEIESLAEQGTDFTDIRAGGRSSKEWPDKENNLWWLANGPAQVADYVTWRDARFAEGWQFANIAGRPAVEVPFHTVLGDVLVKGYIDRVFINDAGEAVVVDLKSGSSKPNSSLQLGVYALGLADTVGLSPSVGAYYMTRRKELTEMQSLLHYTPEMVGNWFSKAKQAIESEVFLPHVTPMCSSCSVAPYCAAVGGSDMPLRSRSSSSNL